ncbi:MAG: hypothetical protein SFW36_08625, partial [Leptolyngbyaceae cyanobacterium bins.59]|nr:hypothetical protein [Leptolyngbyaceae cyanobacterium bins.59]
MRVAFINQIVQDLEAFNQSSEQELATLKADGLLSREGYELVREIMDRSLKPLESILNQTLVETFPESAVLSLVEQYKTKVSRQILEVRSHAYSSKRLLSRMRELIRSQLADISNRIRSERTTFPFAQSVLTQLDQVKTIKAEIDNLQTGLVNRFERELQFQGESQRLFLFEAIAEEFNEKLSQLIDSHLQKTEESEFTAISSPALDDHTDLLGINQLKTDLAEISQQLQSLLQETNQLAQALQNKLIESEALTQRLQQL